MVRLCVCYAASAAPSLEAQFGLFGGGPGSVFEANFRAYPVSFIDKVRSPRHAVRTALRTVHASLPARQPDLENGDKGTRGSRERLARTRGAHARLPRATPVSDVRGRSARSRAATLGAGSTECAFAHASCPRQLLTRSLCRPARSVAAHRVPDAFRDRQPARGARVALWRHGVCGGGRPRLPAVLGTGCMLPCIAVPISRPRLRPRR